MSLCDPPLGSQNTQIAHDCNYQIINFEKLHSRIRANFRVEGPEKKTGILDVCDVIMCYKNAVIKQVWCDYIMVTKINKIR